MAALKDSRTNFYDEIPFEFDKPTTHLQSDGELLIKELVRKQTDTNVHLKDQLLHQKKFVKSSNLAPITSVAAGQSSLEHFKQSTDSLELNEAIKFYDLTSYETQLLNDYHKGEQHLLDSYKNIPETILLERVNDVLKKVENKRNTNDLCSANSISRHVRELALSIKPNSDETKLYQFALLSNSAKTKDNNKVPEKHPINHLHDLTDELFGHLDRPPVPPLPKRRKQLRELTEKCQEYVDIVNKTESSNVKTKWDKKEITVCNSTKNVKHYTCTPQQFYTIKDNQIVKLDDVKSSKISQDDTYVCERIKISEEEIRNIDKFRNYEKGTPSKVLYIKNISNKVKEEDLKNLFKYNETHGVSYRLLTGKMKGQAFITFNSIEQSTEALLNYNGYILHGKPIVIQYGRNKTQ